MFLSPVLDDVLWVRYYCDIIIIRNCCDICMSFDRNNNIICIVCVCTHVVQFRRKTRPTEDTRVGLSVYYVIIADYNIFEKIY